MHTVLGLSLKSDDVAWALLDTADGAVLDHDALQPRGDGEIAAAARGARAIARACGFEVDRVRLTWTADAASAGLRLRRRLERLGFGDVEFVPIDCATTVLVDPEATSITPRLALAYGAARAVVQPSEAITAPVTQQITKRSRLTRRRIVSAALGVAAAVTLGLLCLSAGAPSQFPPPSMTAEGNAPSDDGWATVPVPSDVTATPVRKVVAAPPYIEPPSTVPPQDFVPVRAVAGATPEPTPVSARVPHLSGAPSGAPHLSGATPAAGPVSGLTDVVPAPPPEPDMTEVVNALVALP